MQRSNHSGLCHDLRPRRYIRAAGPTRLDARDHGDPRPGRLGARSTTCPSPRRPPARCSSTALALGICGTDGEIVRGEYGWAPPGAERLVLGHESLGRVREAPAGSGFAAGDLVVGIVRRPDAVPCGPCAAGEWDFCAQRRVHRARDQAAARLRLGALARRAGVRDQAGPGARGRSACCSSRPAWWRRRGSRSSGSGARATFAPRTVPGHRRRADRPAGGAAGRPARLRGARARPGDRRAEAGARAATRRDLPRQATRRPRGRVDIVVEATGAPAGRRRRRCAGRRATGSSA